MWTESLPYLAQQSHASKSDRTDHCLLLQGQGPRDIETGDAGVECVICMNPLDVERTSARMVTPCNHFFHPDCLNRWMDVKMECPTCRQLLPPP